MKQWTTTAKPDIYSLRSTIREMFRSEIMDTRNLVSDIITTARIQNDISTFKQDFSKPKIKVKK